MSRFIESICMKNGAYQLLDLHQERVNRTFLKFFPEHTPFQLTDVLPDIYGNTTSKVKVTYHWEISSVESSGYSIRKIDTLRIIELNDFDYSYKYANRTRLDTLNTRDYEDVIIVVNGFVTDASYANLIFLRDGAWYTPETYLLYGVKRQYLLRSGAIKEIDIQRKDIHHFEKVGLINALLDPGEIMLPVSAIH